ncbi:MAG: carboxypeptidase regulatory-like domain-containing protein [Acidobacteriales bacterium]|nr:carboxypeptidase regulatory-like domain-containing protein [Terriglobales bacterium]
MKRLVITLALTLPLLAGPKQSAQLDFVVVKDVNGKPIRNASVILHGVDKNGKQKKDAYEAKTDAEGKTSMSGLDYGKYRIQVLAEHFQTYGEDVEVAEPQKAMTIKLKSPQQQYSIY